MTVRRVTAAAPTLNDTSMDDIDAGLLTSLLLRVSSPLNRRHSTTTTTTTTTITTTTTTTATTTAARRQCYLPPNTSEHTLL